MGNMTFTFADRTVVVTGAARGIGLAICERFAQAGATVYLVDADTQAVTEAAIRIGGVGLTADVSDTPSVQAAVDRVVTDTGRIDVLVNNAGILRDRMVWKLTDDDYGSVMAVHAGGTFRFTRACTPHFRSQGHGRVINITSYTGLRGNVGQANYAMAKAGIIGFTKATAKELGPFGVTVNAISPNAETRMIETIPQGQRDQIASQIPLRRWGTPREMADAVAFLATDEAAYITGAIVPVDGGIAI
ncbi:3-oxoacyl-ACP reductase family protein [Nocardioides sp. NPDC058538]|uniref:3-oxoacyl-ACP reductase family protein n=1 Tax=Nocardioides sp. NPDC058538 TaxID=3346542 RepID=UPI00365F0682